MASGIPLTAEEQQVLAYRLRHNQCQVAVEVAQEQQLLKKEIHQEDRWQRLGKADQFQVSLMRLKGFALCWQFHIVLKTKI